MKSINRYEVDEKNRLIIKRGSKKLLARGRFNIDRKNQLSYLLNEPASWRELNNLPSKITFEGRWQVDSNHDLIFELSETSGRLKRDNLVIKAEIVSVDSNLLAVEIKSYNDNGLCSVQVLELSGIWQADEYNRINFCIERKFVPDTLLFKGAWQVNKNQQVAYTY
ncbi:MAG: hypothetical protein PHO70_00165 [Candidatus Omnitrophica bacterium]|nr:hypothetical protein [Candidatus Omnitrophota bacterium]